MNRGEVQWHFPAKGSGVLARDVRDPSQSPRYASHRLSVKKSTGTPILRPVSEASTLDSMRDYYAQRAEYYERVYLQPEREPDLRAMEQWLPSMFEGRRVLEIACGTGWWTQHGARRALDWLATDLNPGTTVPSTARSPVAGGAMYRWDGWQAGSTRSTHDSTAVRRW